MAKPNKTIRLVHLTTVPNSLVFLNGQPRYMKSQGYDVEIVSSPGPVLAAFGQQEGVNVRGISMKRQISPLADLRSIVGLTAAFRNARPAIVHAHTPKGGLLGMIAARFARVPVRVYHVRGLPHMTAKGMTRRLLLWSERVSCFLADRVFCVSASIRDELVREGICSSHKTAVFRGGSGNGVDAMNSFNPQRFSASQRNETRAELGIGGRDLVVGFVGRLAHDKGIDELSMAWARLRDEHPAAHLVLVGRLDERDPVRSATLERLRGDNRVHIVGEVNDPSLMYSIFDLLVLPSYREGFGNVLIEGASMEIPTIATLIPGCVDAVQNGVTGTLVPAHDANALAVAIHRYLATPELRLTHGKAGRERVLQHFLDVDIWSSIAREYHDLLDREGIQAHLSESGKARLTNPS